MAKYFLHLRDSSDEVLDDEGVELGSLEEVKAAALAAARDVMVADVSEGLIDLRFRIDVEDEHGAIVYSLGFQHAVNIVPPAG
jgi:hypothetical protein